MSHDTIDFWPKTKKSRAALIKRTFKGLAIDLEIGCLICGKDHDYNICEGCLVDAICQGLNCNDAVETAMRYTIANYDKVLELRRENSAGRKVRC